MPVLQAAPSPSAYYPVPPPPVAAAEVPISAAPAPVVSPAALAPPEVALPEVAPPTAPVAAPSAAASTTADQGAAEGADETTTADALPDEPPPSLIGRFWPFSWLRASERSSDLPALPSSAAEPIAAGTEPAGQTLPAAEGQESAATEGSAELVETPEGELPSGDPADGAAASSTVVVEAPPKLWTGNVDVGLNGSEGNTKLFNIRGGLVAIRETAFSKITLKLNYLNTDANRVETADRLFFDGRHEWIRPTNLWSAYIHETTEYDQFQPWDVRINVDGGLGYQFIKNDITTLAGRIGPGFSREFGGPDDQWVPELVFGGAWERVISANQKLITQVDFFPNITDFSQYRVNTQAAWQITFDQVNNLSVKFSITDRYDSTPNGALPNDIDYATTLVWGF